MYFLESQHLLFENMLKTGSDFVRIIFYFWQDLFLPKRNSKKVILFFNVACHFTFDHVGGVWLFEITGSDVRGAVFD